MPFHQTFIDAFDRRIRNAARITAGEKPLEAGEKEVYEEGKANVQYVVTTLEDMRKTFVTEAWAGLKQDDSEISKLVTHEIFASSDGKIDIEKLLLFAILHCAGNNTRKSEAMYCVFQYGGQEKQAFLTANDKDIAPAIENLMKLVTYDLTVLMRDVSG